MGADNRQPAVAAARWALTAVIVAALVCVGSLLATPARASNDQITIFDATPSLLGGESAEYRFGVLDRLQALGTDTIRILVPWRSMAPEPDSSTKPAGFDASNPIDYPPGRFQDLDQAVVGATVRGMDVLLTPTSPIPDWASGNGHSELFAPQADEFEEFVTALGIRYSGACGPPVCISGLAGSAPLPRVSSWAVWNEPNLKLFLRPQRLRNGNTVSGRIYRRLFFAAQRGLESSSHEEDPLLVGETAPSRGSTSTGPLNFLRQALCLSEDYELLRSDCDPIRAAGWAHHPYNPYNPPWQKPNRHKRIISIATLPSIMRALDRAAAAGATVDRLPVYVTEYGVESLPEDRYGVSLQRQAEFLGISEYLLYRDPRVRAYSQYLLRDDRFPHGKTSFQTGLRFSNDASKPSYDAFPLTLVARRYNASGVQLWGHVRQGEGPYDVSIRFRNGEDGASRPLDTIETGADGYFSFFTPFRKGREWRATCHLSDGRLLKGTFVRSYRFD
jgi:hypothetical protein